MGIQNATIYLENESKTYYPGQEVNGRIEYEVDNPIKVRGIRVKFRGEANTEWSASTEELNADDTSETEDTTYTGEKKFFQYSYYVLGSNSGAEIEIPAGKNVYNFTYALPPVLPSSFEGPHGYVRYTIKVTLDRPLKFDQETKIAFTVINALDLNLNPSYKVPIHMQMETTFCCLCCTSLPLSVNVRAPVSRYCSGQGIPIQVDVENMSNVVVNRVKICLRKIVTYRASSPSTATKITKHNICSVQTGSVQRGVTDSYSLRLEVPSTLPSNLDKSSIIDIDYELKAECELPFMHFNMKDKKYITIGTVPLRDVVGQSPPSAPLPPEGSENQPAVLPVSPGQPAQPNQSAGGEAAAGGLVLPGSPGQAPYQSL